jgi:hypothetical protein
MPLTPIKYENGLIYKIVCNDTSITDCYVGSTTNIVKRRQKHKYNSNHENSKDYNMYVYQFIRDHDGWENWSLVLIENHSCNNKLELEKRERYYIEELKATLNKKIPTRSNKEWREDNKEKLKEKKKVYCDVNKEKIRDRKKEYRENNKEQIKKYYEENKEQISEKWKEYYETNKDYLLEKRKVKITCECGCKIANDSLSRHKVSSKHINLMKLK